MRRKAMWVACKLLEVDVCGRGRALELGLEYP